MNLLGRLLSQCGKPRGRFGRFLVRGMNFGHSGLTRWGLTKVEIRENETVLDIGCGGGRALECLASLASLGKVVGIDYSEDSVAVARKRNQRLARCPRCHSRTQRLTVFQQSKAITSGLILQQTSLKCGV